MDKSLLSQAAGESGKEGMTNAIPLDAGASAMHVADCWVRAVNQGDVEAMTDVFAPDAQFFGTTTKTVISSIDGIKNYFSAAFAAFSPLNLSLGPVTVSALSATSAVITGYDKWHVTAEGKPNEMIGRLTLVVQEVQGGWRIVSFHRSAMPQ